MFQHYQPLPSPEENHQPNPLVDKKPNCWHPNYKWRSGGIKTLAKGNKTSHWEELETAPATPEPGVTQNPVPRHLPEVQRWNCSSSEAVKVRQLISVKPKYNPIGLLCLCSNYPNFLRQSICLDSKCHRGFGPSCVLGHSFFRRKPRLGRVVHSTAAGMWPAGCTCSTV